MVVGESGSGKSTNVKVLAQALSLLYEEKVVDKDGFYKIVDCLVLNPKSITAGEFILVLFVFLRVVLHCIVNSPYCRQYWLYFWLF